MYTKNYNIIFIQFFELSKFNTEAYLLFSIPGNPHPESIKQGVIIFVASVFNIAPNNENVELEDTKNDDCVIVLNCSIVFLSL